MSVISDQNAITIFQTISERAWAHAGDKHQMLCDVRADKIARTLREEFGVDNVEKAWIHAKMPDGSLDHLQWPLETYDLVDRSTQTEPIEVNFHVAPLVKTTSGKELIFDTKLFKDTPPQLQTWKEAFPPMDSKSEAFLEISSPETLYFKDVLNPQTSNGHIMAAFRRALETAWGNYYLWTAPVQKHSTRLTSHWHEKLLNSPPNLADPATLEFTS